MYHTFLKIVFNSYFLFNSIQFIQFIWDATVQYIFDLYFLATYEYETHFLFLQTTKKCISLVFLFRGYLENKWTESDAFFFEMSGIVQGPIVYGVHLPKRSMSYGYVWSILVYFIKHLIKYNTKGMLLEDSFGRWYAENPSPSALWVEKRFFCMSRPISPEVYFVGRFYYYYYLVNERKRLW